MSDFVPFDFEGNEVRFVGTPENPEWVAADICRCLDLEDTSKALESLDLEEKDTKNVRTLGGMQQMLTVTEPGLYRLIFKSRKTVAKRFQKWVFNEILPSIRKTGMYSIQQKSVTPPELLPVQIRQAKLEVIQTGIDIISQLGGIDERDEMQFKDLARSIVLDDVLQPALPQADNQRLEYPISDRALELGYKPTPGQLRSIGKGAAALYRARYSQEPIKREQFVDGTTRKVNVYSQKDLPILDQAIKRIMDKNK